MPKGTIAKPGITSSKKTTSKKTTEKETPPVDAPKSWYDYPQYYDLGFKDDTLREARFFEKAFVS